MTYIANRNWLIEVSKGNIPGHSIKHLFGGSPDIGTTLSGVSIAKTFPTPTAAQSLEILSSDNTNDVAGGTGARQVTFVGMDNTGVYQTVTVNLNGTTPVAITGTYIRIEEAWVSQSGTYATDKTPSHNSEITIRVAGAGATWGIIGRYNSNYGYSRTLIAGYTIPLGYTAFMLSMWVTSDTAKSVDILLAHRPNILDVTAPMDALQVKPILIGMSGTTYIEHLINDSFEELTDVFFLAKTASGTSAIYVESELLIVDNNYL